MDIKSSAGRSLRRIFTILFQRSKVTSGIELCKFDPRDISSCIQTQNEAHQSGQEKIPLTIRWALASLGSWLLKKLELLAYI
jgi:hypothetical protein